MKKRPLSVLCFGLIASLTAANVAQSAGVSARASATIVVSTHVSTSVAAPCNESKSGGANGRCPEPLNLQVVKDGTLNGTQGVSLTLTREADASNAATATLAYD
jgi:hypothetical protein